MKNKYAKLLIFVSVLFVLALITTASYAYFVINVNGNDSAFESVITTGSMKLEFNDGQYVYATNIVPSQSVSKVFAVTNSGNIDTVYDVYLSEVINTFADKHDLVYSVLDYYGNSSSGACTNLNETVLPSESGDESKIVSACPIGPGDTHVYVLNITFKEDGTNQDDNKGKGFKGALSVNEYKDAVKFAELAPGREVHNRIHKHFAKIYMDYVDNNLDSWCSSMQNMSEYQGMTCDELRQVAFNDLDTSNSLSFDSLSVVHEIPQGVEKVDISSPLSAYRVYFFYDLINHLAYIYSDQPIIYMNDDSSYMFNSIDSNCTIDLTGLDSSHVTNMSNMFSYSYGITSLNLGDNFDTSNVEDMSMMFYSIMGLTNLNLGDKFDTSKVKNFNYAFSTMENLQTLNLGNKFNTSSATDISYMFRGNKKLTSLSLGNLFDTSKVTNMRNLFYGMEAVQTIDLGPLFTVSGIVNARNMFTNCKKLTTIYAPSDFSFASGSNTTSMFTSCARLKGGAGTSYDSSNVTGTYARIDGGTSKPGYFTLRSV